MKCAEEKTARAREIQKKRNIYDNYNEMHLIIINRNEGKKVSENR